MIAEEQRRNEQRFMSDQSTGRERGGIDPLHNRRLDLNNNT